MKYRLLAYLLVFYYQIAAQEQASTSSYNLDINYTSGNITLHNDGILHLITGHPEGVIIGVNRKTFGKERWQQEYKYPDLGASFIYQDLKNEHLGKNIGLYGHYNFYFFNRNLMFRIGQGVALTSNPYNRETNHKNNAFGSKLLSSTFLMLNYRKERILNKFGFQTGLSVVHYSNANVKAPNTSINILAFNAGITYNFEESVDERIETSFEKFTEPWKYNFVFRSGVNESDIIGSGQFPFYILSGYADKRLSYKSAIQFGVDVFFSNFLKEFNRYQAIAFPDRNYDPDRDYKRLGLFIGHELFINKLSVVTQAGYYAYYPVDFEGRLYLRAGLKRYFGKQWFGAITVKAHGAAAEAVEFGIGIRL